MYTGALEGITGEKISLVAKRTTELGIVLYVLIQDIKTVLEIEIVCPDKEVLNADRELQEIMLNNAVTTKAMRLCDYTHKISTYADLVQYSVPMDYTHGELSKLIKSELLVKQLNS